MLGSKENDSPSLLPSQSLSLILPLPEPFVFCSIHSFLPLDRLTNIFHNADQGLDLDSFSSGSDIPGAGAWVDYQSIWRQWRSHAWAQR